VTLQYTWFPMIVLAAHASAALAQPTAPRYSECRVDTIFPAGGQRGTTVMVEMRGVEAGLSLPKEVIIDGPPGITVKEMKSVNGYIFQATLEIAADAPLGRRWLRLANERSGLTNFAYFVVGGVPERLEVEPNHEIATAEAVEVPVVLNGRINPAADIDLFRFSGKKGQKLVAAIAAHALDVHGQSGTYGIADFSLDLLDANGRTLVSVEDSLGFDPLIEHTLPYDGEYYVRVQLLNYLGFHEAVYRLTLGEVAYVTGAFPPGYRRGVPTEIELIGPNVAPGTKRILGKIPGAQAATGAVSPAGRANWLGDECAEWERAFTLRHVGLDAVDNSGLDIPIVTGDLMEVLEAEPNDDRSQAVLLSFPTTVNGRFQQSNDVDWYGVHLEAKQKVRFEIMAHRFLRSPVDTLIEVFDAEGKLLAENDDESFDPSYEQYHDFKTTDSKLNFTAPVTGEFFVKVIEQSGESGPRSVYRMTVEEDAPYFRLTHFPDAVPVWGPGSTSCLLVRVDRLSGCDDDVELSVEGLPTGWSSASATSFAARSDRSYIGHQMRVFLSITAPADAVPGTTFPIRVVGRAKRGDGKAVECTSLPLTLFFTSDTGFFRASPVSRVGVAKPQGPWLHSLVKEVSIPQGGEATVLVQVLGAGELKQMPIAVNAATNGVACVLTTPQNLPIINGQVEVPVKLGPELPPGTYTITFAQTWGGDIRVGMPGPCTPMVKLNVLSSK